MCPCLAIANLFPMRIARTGFEAVLERHAAVAIEMRIENDPVPALHKDRLAGFQIQRGLERIGAPGPTVRTIGRNPRWLQNDLRKSANRTRI